MMQLPNVGDTIEYVDTVGFSRRKVLRKIKVERFTKSQIVCSDERGREVRYRINTMRKVGDLYSKFPKQVDNDERQSVLLAKKRFDLASHLESTDWGSKPMETLERVFAILAELER